MKLVLIGYRGTGKTEVGKGVAARLGLRYIGMDAEIERRAGMDIPEIVRRHGWEHFRDLESQLAAELGDEDNCVIDTGGGVVVREENVRHLRKNALVVWLKAEPETIARRIRSDTRRPSLTGNKSFIDEIEEVLHERLPLYRAAADISIDTEEKSVEEVIGRVVELFRTHAATTE